MRSLAISGVALAAMMISPPALAEIDSTVGAPPVVTVPPVSDSTGAPDRPRDKVPANAQRIGTPDQRVGTLPIPVAASPMPQMAQTPVSRRRDYQRPSYGFQLPQTWMTPENYVDYRAFDLDRPAPGFGWSRYYDDMVLTDQWGRVYDVANDDGRDFDRGSRRGHRFGSRNTDGLAGGIGGAAVGAVAGNLIAGAGSRLAGSLIGGGVGALAGLAIEAALAKKGHRHDRYDRRADDDGGDYRRGFGGHWGGYPAQSWGYQNCNCGSGETVTTTTTTYHGGGGYMVPRQVVTYENVYAPIRTKYVTRAVAPTKYRVREEAPVADGKTRIRTKLHPKTY